MSFEKGARYTDAVGRKWKVVKVIHQGDHDILLVRRRLKMEVALTNPDWAGTATVLFSEFGFTTLYESDAE